MLEDRAAGLPDFGDFAGRAAELALRMAVAGAVIVAFALAGRLTAPIVRRLLSRRGRPSYTRVFGGVYRVGVTIVGCLFALTLAFPSVRVADVLGIFGIVSVALGFAFKDTFENLLAGVLLLLRDPFKSGDEVTIANHEGTVEGVTVRETLLRGHNGRQYFIPNALVMTGVIEVATDRAALRQSFSLRFPPAADFARVRPIVVAALRATPGVLAEPPPAVRLVDLVDGEVEVACRFWGESRRQAATLARDAAIAAVLAALVDNDVSLAADEVAVTINATEPSATPGRRGPQA